MATPQPPKKRRDRSALGSSDADEPCTHKEIIESLDQIHVKLQKLTLLDELANDVKDLKASLEFSDSMIETLKTDNAALRLEVIRLTRLTDDLQREHRNMDNNILDLQCRSMRDNIIFHGLPEQKNKTHQYPEELVKTFLVAKLNIKSEEAASIDFARVHRLGKPKVDANGRVKSRPIVANVTNSKMKSAVMSKGKELKNTTYSITDQFPAEIMDRRRPLYPIMTEARKNKKKARLAVDKLYNQRCALQEPRDNVLAE